MEERPTESRGGVKGGFPLAGSRGGAPLWGLGQRPNCCSSSLLKKRSQQSAGNEASLPVTLRIRRCAPNLLYPLLAHCRAKWARPDCWSCDHSDSSPQAEDFASAEATRGQWKRTKSAIAPLTPSARTLPCSFAPFGNLRRHFSPKSKTATSFPLNPSAERGRPFIPFYFPDGCISVNVW